MRSTLWSSRRDISSIMLLVFFLSVFWIHPARSQTPDRNQEIQQLKDKLQQLDQTMGEGKAEIDALERQGQQHPAEAQKASAQPQPQTAVPSEAIVAQPQADAVPLEGEITEAKDSLNIYGFAMLDSGYDFGQEDPNWFDVLRPTKLPSFYNEFAPSGNVYAGVRQTRFGVRSRSRNPDDG